MVLSSSKPIIWERSKFVVGLCIDFYFLDIVKLPTVENGISCFVTPIQIFIQVFLFYSSSYNAIKSYKTEGRAERLEATEYLISAAEAGKVVCEI